MELFSFEKEINDFNEMIEGNGDSVVISLGDGTNSVSFKSCSGDSGDMSDDGDGVEDGKVDTNAAITDRMMVTGPGQMYDFLVAITIVLVVFINSVRNISKPIFLKLSHINHFFYNHTICEMNLFATLHF